MRALASASCLFRQCGPLIPIEVEHVRRRYSGLILGGHIGSSGFFTLIQRDSSYPALDGFRRNFARRIGHTKIIGIDDQELANPS